MTKNFKKIKNKKFVYPADKQVLYFSLGFIALRTQSGGEKKQAVSHCLSVYRSSAETLLTRYQSTLPYFAIISASI